ncbi:phage tail spike protein [Fredinandcohnia sp. 179-A 10B2 NHS]|uniref:phage tail spike protein n=1 Tax=Fredinandcohnia sp. 179-A 10B2 NHS TaxID=3235176 RepID=UPI0039A0327B
MEKLTLVHILDKQTDQILGTLNPNKAEYWNPLRTDSLNNLNIFDFRANAKIEKAALLEKRNRLLLEDEDGFFREYLITYAEQYKRGEKLVKSNATYLDLAKSKVIEPQTIQGATPSTSVQLALDGTEWQSGDIDYTFVRTITIEDYTDPYNLLKKIASTFGLELRFRVVVVGNRVVGRFVDLKLPNTEFSGTEVEFGKDLVGVKRKEDSQMIVTALLGIGPERDDGTKLTVFVEDKEALQRWGRNGQHLIETYEPESTNTDMTLAELTTYTKTELQKRIDAIVSYECEAVSLEHIKGFEHKKIRVGYNIRISDDGYQPPLYLEARIQDVDIDPITHQIKKFTIGNFKEIKKEDLEKQVQTLKTLIKNKASLQQAVLKGDAYKGVSISEEEGFLSVSDDELVRTTYNADVGVLIETRNTVEEQWESLFYVDPITKKIKFTGDLEGASGTFDGTLRGSLITSSGASEETSESWRTDIQSGMAKFETWMGGNPRLDRYINFRGGWIEYEESKIDKGFTPATLINGWTNYRDDYESAGYLKDPFGFIHFRGSIKGTSSSTVAFVLPVGDRPFKTLYFGLVCGFNSVATARITPDGNVLIAGPDLTYISLDNIPPIFIG